jgi:hypothetical protein
LEHAWDDELFHDVLVQLQRDNNPTDPIDYFVSLFDPAQDAIRYTDVFGDELEDLTSSDEEDEDVVVDVDDDVDEEMPDVDILEGVSDKVKTDVKNLMIRNTCVICHINVRNIVFTPCNHLVACTTCSRNANMGDKCPLCRKRFTSTIRVFS